LLLHALAALLVFFALPSLMQPPPEVLHVVPIDLVALGQVTASPARQQLARLPQDQASESSRLRPVDPVPQTQAPPPVPQAHLPPPNRAIEADPLATMTLKKTAALAGPRIGPPSHPVPALKPPKNPPPPLDDLQTQLKSLALQQQQQARTPPNPTSQDGPGSSNLTASSENAAPGRQTLYSAKDFIRAQIERHWYFDRTALGAGDFVISMHLELMSDGSVSRADILGETGGSARAADRSVAISLRDAALMSSPLNLPTGRYEDVKDMVLNFSSRDVSQ